MRKLIALFMVIVLAGGCLMGLSSCGKEGSADTSDSSAASTAPVHVEIDVVDYGVIKLELYPDIAPITVENFVNLAKSGFYDGLIFHRVIEGFMIQGGDPEGTGFGGSDKTIKGEFSANGVKNDLLHERGVISMARSQKYDSASSQFFICHETKPHLDGLYAAFGKVTEGMDVVDRIAAVKTNGNDKPLVDVVIKTIRVTD